VSLSLDPHKLRKALDPRLGRNTLLHLEIADRPEASCDVLVKDAQVDTLRDEVLHVDLVRVTEDSPVEVRVPLVLTGRAEGVRLGGRLQQILRKIPVRCKAGSIPTSVEVDTTAWLLHHQLRAEDLPLPEGVEVLLQPRQKLATIASGRGAEEETAGGEPEAETSEQGAEASAPAAG